MNRYLGISIVFIILFLVVKAQFMDDPPVPHFNNKPNKTHLYITSDSLAAHLGTSPNSGTIDHYLSYRDRIKIHERNNGWVRFTNYFDGKKLGLTGDAAFWVNEAFLSRVQPPAKENTALDSVDLVE
ncbi:MAG: hypothetical protein OCC49_10830 [Fibrobacterales bacterium]